MNLATWSIRNPIPAVLLFVLLSLAGFWGFARLPISLEHAQTAGSLPGPHRDPFDRTLIAQAQLERIPIVSIDEVFDAYVVKRIW